MTKFSRMLLGEYHLMRSRIVTHVVFWLMYYVFFSFLWARNGDYFKSFELEFIVMPVRIAASYVSIYYLIPHLLVKERIERFFMGYLLVIGIGGFLQRILTYYFHERFFVATASLWDAASYVRAAVLINTTVMLLTSLKIFLIWRAESRKNTSVQEVFLEIKSNKRIYRILPSEIKFIEGMGNYLTIYLSDRKPVVAYMPLKEIKSILPEYFVRIHKSYIINKERIDSYSTDSVEIDGRIVPIGKSFSEQTVWP